MEAVLYQDPARRGWLILPEGVEFDSARNDFAYKMLQPTQLAFLACPFK